MITGFEQVVLRRPEPKDIEQLYTFRNDWEVIRYLGGFTLGYSIQDLHDWVEFHRNQANEVIWIIADKTNDSCIGHVGFYVIDHRIRQAEFALLIGDKTRWGKGLGQEITKAVIDFGFDQLNLHRIELEVLSSNSRAIHIYKKLGFVHEGTKRDAQYRSGAFVDVITMAILEYERNWR